MSDVRHHKNNISADVFRIFLLHNNNNSAMFLSDYILSFRKDVHQQGTSITICGLGAFFAQLHVFQQFGNASFLPRGELEVVLALLDAGSPQAFIRRGVLEQTLSAGAATTNCEQDSAPRSYASGPVCRCFCAT